MERGNLTNTARRKRVASTLDIGQKRARSNVIRIQAIEDRVTNLETSINDIAEIKTYVVKIVRYIKIAVPSIISAAVAAGLVNGKIGAFLHALSTGVSQ